MIKFKWSAVDLRQKPNQREKIIFAAALLIFSFGFLKSCWAPSRQSIAAVKDQLKNMETQKEELAKMTNLPEALQKTNAAAPNLLQKSPSGVGSMKDVENALHSLSQPMMLKGVELTGIKFTDLVREGPLARQKVELELAGSFTNVGRYVDSIESLATPFIIEEFSMMVKDEKSSRVATEIKGSFYGKE